MGRAYPDSPRQSGEDSFAELEKSALAAGDRHRLRPRLPEKLAKLREHRGNREQEVVKLLHVYVFGIPKCGTFIGVKLMYGINLRDVSRSAIDQNLSNKRNFRAIAKKAFGDT